MRKDKKRFEWIKRLDESEIERLLNKNELLFKLSEETKLRTEYMIRNSKEKAGEKKKIPVLKYALSFSALVVVFTGILLTINIFKNKPVENISLNSCIVKSINGSSYLLDEASGEKKALSAGDAISENAVIITEADTEVELEIADNSVVLIKEKSKLKALKLFKDNAVKKTLLELVAGEIENTLDKLNQGSTFEVETKTVTVGVRGTAFSVKVKDNNDTVVSVSKGEVFARLNTDKRAKEFIELLSKMNKEKVTAVYDAEKTVKAGETLEVKYEDYLKSENESQKIINTIKSGVEKNPDYEVEEKILTHIKDIREIILRIEKVNEADDKKKEDVKKVETKISLKQETKIVKAVENKAEEKLVYDVIKSTVLKADPGKDVYEVIKSVFGDNSFHTPDYDEYHRKVPHILQEKDDIVGNYFKFVVHRDQDRYSFGSNIQNKVSIYATGNSQNNILAFYGDSLRFYFKMKVDKDMFLSSNRTGFFSFSPFYNSTFNTLTTNIVGLQGARKNNKDLLQITYTPEKTGSVIAESDFSKIRGKWIQIECIITFSDKGYLKFNIKDLSGNKILSVEEKNIILWREKTNSFVPGFLLLRNLNEKQTFRKEDESVSFADITIEKIKIK